MKQIPATRLFLFAFALLLGLGGLGLSARADGLDPWALVSFIAAVALVVAAFVGKGKR